MTIQPAHPRHPRIFRTKGSRTWTLVAAVVAAALIAAVGSQALAAGGSGATTADLSAARPGPSAQAGARAASSATGGGTSGTVTLHSASALTLATSPDHGQLVMNFLGNLWTLPAAGGTAKRISSWTQDTAYPDWSPDGRTIAFQSYASGTFNIWAMDPDGTNVRALTTGYYDDREPKYSPDGTKIAFSSDRPVAGSPPGTKGGSYNIWVLTLATGALSEITSASPTRSDYYPTWSPDGQQIAFVNTSHEIDSIAADGSGSTTVLYSDPGGTFYSPTWSPDGQTLAYVEHTANPDPATTLMVNGNAVSGNEDVFPFAARWVSSDTVVYAADGKIWQRNVASGDVTPIPFTAKVPYDRQRYQMKKHNFGASKRQPVKGIVSPALSPDGRQVAFVALNQLWDMQIGHRPQRLTHDPYYKVDPTWSPDGRYLAYSSDQDGPGAIYIRDMRTGDTRRLTAPFTGSEAEMAWSPDGKKLAFQSSINGETEVNTYVADVASGNFQQVLDTQFEPGRPTWGPDSNTLALAAWRPYSNRYREGTSEILTVDVSTGATTWYDPYTNPYETINNRVNDDGPVWSPDGTSMAYVLDDALWVQPVTTAGAPAGPARQLTTEVADHISWSGDSRHILYDSAGKLRLISAAGGRPTTVKVPLSWRPDVTRGTTVVNAGSLWDGTSDSLRHDVDIVVRGNRIVSVGPAKDRSRYGQGVRYVDASDLTVMPGMWDSHVHEQLDQPYAGGRRNRIEMAFGITSVMSMGDPAYSALEESESQQTGARVGPRYFWAAEPVDGTRIYYNFMRATDNETSLHRDLARIAAVKPDILKTYVRLPNTYEGQAIAAGHRMGIPSFSHYFWPALALGQDGTSHWATQRLGYQIATSANTVAYDDTVQLYGQSGMSITNTPFFGVQYFQYLLDDPRLEKLLTPWQYSNAEAEYAAGPLPPASVAFAKGWGDADRKILEAGGTVLSGTDASLGIGDFGQVVAMGVMAHTGLSNYQVLRASTVEPAKVMGLSNQLGTIQPGMIADMDMVHGNPLEDMNAVANEGYVMQNGRLYTEEQLIGPYADGPSNTPPAAKSAPAAAKAQSRLLAGSKVRLTTAATQRKWHMWGMAPMLPPGTMNSFRLAR